MTTLVETAARWRFVPRAALAAATLLLVAGISIIFYNDRTYRQQTADETKAQAAIVAASITAALDFDDAATVREYVNALRANPKIEAAGVYDEHGTRLASYARSARLPPERVMPGESRIEGSAATVIEPVAWNGSVIGTVYLRSTIEPVSRRITRYSVIALLAVMAALVVAVLGAAHAALRKANLALLDRARDLADTNRELEVQIEEREKAEEALRQAQKMEAVGQLTGGIAHDFNNLLTVIAGNLDLAQRVLEDGGNVRLKRLVDNAQRGADRAAALTQRLLAFSRRQPLAPKPTDINKLVAGMADLLHRALAETIRLDLIAAGGLWKVEIDQHQLESAILNLAVNARDAMPDGGKLTIETSNVWLDDAYVATHPEVTPGQYVVIAVSDTGTGMSKDTLMRVFEPFFTTKEAGKGTGLGLSMVYGFVKQSGGHIKLDSEPGEGTTVKLYLPRLLTEDAAHEVRGEATLIPGRPDETILVVEDDDDVRAYTVEILCSLNYRVLEAMDGSSALRLIETRDGPIHLLFTDVVMPGMTGRQLAEKACRLIPGLKVLYASGYARDAIVHGGRLDPGVEMVSKPFTSAVLASKVRMMLDRKLLP